MVDPKSTVMTKARSKISIIFQAGMFPKSEDRLFFMTESCVKHLTYDQWKSAFQMGIDEHVAK